MEDVPDNCDHFGNYIGATNSNVIKLRLKDVHVDNDIVSFPLELLTNLNFEDSQGGTSEKGRNHFLQYISVQKFSRFNFLLEKLTQQPNRATSTSDDQTQKQTPKETTPNRGNIFDAENRKDSSSIEIIELDDESDEENGKEDDIVFVPIPKVDSKQLCKSFMDDDGDDTQVNDEEIR